MPGSRQVATPGNILGSPAAVTVLALNNLSNPRDSLTQIE
jgi:hypothetical protein